MGKKLFKKKISEWGPRNETPKKTLTAGSLEIVLLPSMYYSTLKFQKLPCARLNWRKSSPSWDIHVHCVY